MDDTVVQLVMSPDVVSVSVRRHRGDRLVEKIMHLGKQALHWRSPSGPYPGVRRMRPKTVVISLPTAITVHILAGDEVCFR